MPYTKINVLVVVITCVVFKFTQIVFHLIVGILKNPSTSSYPGGLNGSDSGMANTHSFNDSGSASDSVGNVARVPPVSLNPDPTAMYRNQQQPQQVKRFSGDSYTGPVGHSSSTESEATFSAHMPATPQKQAAPYATQAAPAYYQNQAYNKETDIDGDISGGIGGVPDLGGMTPRATSTGRREMQDYSPEGGYDAFAQSQENTQVRRWGGRRSPATVKTPRDSGVSNQAYVSDSQAPVSTVSAQYQQYTTPTKPAPSYSYHTAAPAANTPASPNTSSVSTEV